MYLLPEIYYQLTITPNVIIFRAANNKVRGTESDSDWIMFC